MVVCASVCPSRSCRTAIGAPIRDVSESGCQSKQTLPGGYFIQLAIPIPGGRLWLNAKCAEMIMTRVSALKPTVKSMYSTVLNVRFKRWLPNAHIAIAESSVMEWKAMAGCIVARIAPVIPVFRQWRTEPHRSVSPLLARGV